MEAAFWKRCSNCKKEITFASPYWACNVSTCNRERTALVFCSVACWDGHLPIVRHREAWAVEKTSPRRNESEREQAHTSAPRVDAASAAPEPAQLRDDVAIPRDILVVASKLKSYVRQRSGMNTSDAVLEVLSDRLRELCDAAIRHAQESGRKTVLERDF